MESWTLLGCFEARVFYLDGWHHTELESDSLVSREACLRASRDWLETDRFPEPECQE